MADWRRDKQSMWGSDPWHKLEPRVLHLAKIGSKRWLENRKQQTEITCNNKSVKQKSNRNNMYDINMRCELCFSFGDSYFWLKSQ